MKKTSITNFRNSLFIFFTFITLNSYSAQFDWDELKLSTDLYGSHTDLMTYKGYQNGLSATFKLKYPDFMLQPLAKVSTSHYYYLDERILNNTSYSAEHRYAYGLGLDIIFTNYLKLRLLGEVVTNQVSNRTYQQDSIIVIYSQYLDYPAFQLNNYLEAAMLPRLSTNKFNTYLRMQLLKTIDLNRTNEVSNSVYPFVQFRARDNEEQLFGASGFNTSAGVGYKHFSRHDGKRNFSFLIEAHSIMYQSKEFFSDWAQALAAIQYTF